MEDIFVTNKNAGIINVKSGKNPKSLYLHQIEAIKALNEKIHQQDIYEGLLVIPTGGGKTITAVQWVLKNIIDKGQKVLWIAHRHELLNQALEAVVHNSYSDILQNRKNVQFRVISGMHDRPVNIKPTDDFLIASKDSLNYSLSYLLNNWVKKNADNIFVVIDEAHHAVAKSYRNIITQIKTHSSQSFKMLGLTATPFRTAENEKGLLKKVFNDDITYVIDLKTLISRQILADPIFVDSNTQIDMTYNLTDKDIKAIYSSDKLPTDIAQSIALNKNRNNLIVDHYKQNQFKYGQTLVFALNIQHAIELKAVFEKNGIACDYVVSSITDLYSGVTISKEQNAGKIQAFKKGLLTVLINVNILTEGTDLPNVQTVFLTRPTVSAILMTQMIGRALRGKKAGGTDCAYIVTFFDEWKNTIAWVNPRKLYEDSRTFEDTPAAKMDHTVRLVAISKIEEFAKMMDNTVDTSQFEKLPFIERIPVGLYSFSILVPFTDENNNEKHCDIMVYNTLKQAYEDFLDDIEVIFDNKRLSDRELLTADELACLCEEVKQEYFSGYDTTLGYKDEDLKDILQYYAQTSTLPSFLAFEEREKFDISTIAQDIWDADMGERKKAIYLDQLWNDDKSFLKVFFGDNKKYFINEINHELYKINNGEEQHDAQPNITQEDIEISKLSLSEIRAINPNYWRKIVNAVYERHKDPEGYYCNASGTFRSKSKRNFQIDHIKPISKGGLTVLDNLQLLTRKENAAKNNNFNTDMDEEQNEGDKVEEPVIEKGEDEKRKEFLAKIEELVDKEDDEAAVNMIEEGKLLYHDSEFYNHIGWQYYIMRKYTEARASFEKAMELRDGDVTDLMFYIAFVYFEEGDVDKSEEVTKKVLNRQPNHAQALALLGTIKITTGNYEEALKYSDQAIALDCENDEAYLNRGTVFSDFYNKYDEALENCKKAIAINPKNGDALLQIGYIYQMKENWETALEYYNKGEALGYEKSVVSVYKGLCLRELKRFTSSLDEFSKAIALDDENADAYFYLAYELDRKRKYKEAIQNYERVLELEPDNATALNNMGYIHYKMKVYAKALMLYDQALAIDPDNKLAIANKKNLMKVYRAQ